MKLNSLLLYVSNPLNSSNFYKKLGFKIKDHGYFVNAKLNGFTLTLVDEKRAKFKKEFKDQRGNGIFIYFDVKDVDNFFKILRRKGFTPSSEPRNWPWGNREFALRDPDRYVLIFSQKVDNHFK